MSKRIILFTFLSFIVFSCSKGEGGSIDKNSSDATANNDLCKIHSTAINSNEKISYQYNAINSQWELLPSYQITPDTTQVSGTPIQLSPNSPEMIISGNVGQIPNVNNFISYTLSNSNFVYLTKLPSIPTDKSIVQVNTNSNYIATIDSTLFGGNLADLKGNAGNLFIHHSVITSPLYFIYDQASQSWSLVNSVLNLMAGSIAQLNGQLPSGNFSAINFSLSAYSFVTPVYLPKNPIDKMKINIINNTNQNANICY
nr:hypothetical protein GTC16762_31670 [Pigmentibacter ruber]BFD33588.1 hypothetical protein GTC16762_32070 [Pigmentibacter ruber]BFD33609.1 hypothetical protein GTC16762_32280 [Pigmentibacter ruber]